MDDKIKTTIDSLKKNNIWADYFDSGNDAVNCALDMIPKDAVIGFGGSMTLQGIGLLDQLRERGNEVLDSYDPKLSQERMIEIKKLSLMSDVFMAGTNALTEDGKLVNIDGIGNRCGAFTYGPEKVFIFVGSNKIVKDEQAGVDRIRNVAAPKNVLRLKLNAPCSKTGKCMDCSHPDRICCVKTVHSYQRLKDRLHVFIINEELGF